jgi:hypothetical protein
MLTDISRNAPHASGFSLGMKRPPRVAERPTASRPFVVTRRRSPLHRLGMAVARSRSLVLLLAVFALLNMGDLVSTYVGLHGGLREGNPLMSTLLLHYGFVALIGYKLLVVLAVSAGVFLLRTFHRGIATATIWICNGLVFAVVLLNVLQFVLS